MARHADDSSAPSDPAFQGFVSSRREHEARAEGSWDDAQALRAVACDRSGDVMMDVVRGPATRPMPRSQLPVVGRARHREDVAQRAHSVLFGVDGDRHAQGLSSLSGIGFPSRIGRLRGPSSYFASHVAFSPRLLLLKSSFDFLCARVAYGSLSAGSLTLDRHPRRRRAGVERRHAHPP